MFVQRITNNKYVKHKDRLHLNIFLCLLRQFVHNFSQGTLN
jgi:hypothetical protein